MHPSGGFNTKFADPSSKVSCEEFVKLVYKWHLRIAKSFLSSWRVTTTRDSHPADGAHEVVKVFRYFQNRAHSQGGEDQGNDERGDLEDHGGDTCHVAREKPGWKIIISTPTYPPIRRRRKRRRGTKAKEEVKSKGGGGSKRGRGGDGKEASMPCSTRTLRNSRRAR